MCFSDVNDSLWNLSQRIIDVENENAELNAIIEKQEKKIKQLELASEGNVLATITEGDSAYEVDVSVDTLPYATIDKIGGMTYKSENNLRDSKVTEIISAGANLLPRNWNGINDTIELTKPLKANEKYTMCIYVTTNVADGKGINVFDERGNQLFSNSMASWGQPSDGWNSFVITPVIDTKTLRINAYGIVSKEMEGAILKGALVTEKKYNSINLFKPYKQPTAIAIPTAIQNLDGYGQSNFEDNNEYNYIDFENKKFIRYGYYEGETWKSSYLETDIAEFLQDNVIEVESGGTLTFENEYKQDVPFTWTFQEKL